MANATNFNFSSLMGMGMPKLFGVDRGSAANANNNSGSSRRDNGISDGGVDRAKELNYDKIFSLPNVGKLLKMSKDGGIKNSLQQVTKEFLNTKTSGLGEKFKSTEIPLFERMATKLDSSFNTLNTINETAEKDSKDSDSANNENKDQMEESSKDSKKTSSLLKENVETNNSTLLVLKSKLDKIEVNTKVIGNLMGDSLKSDPTKDLAANEKEDRMKSSNNFDNLGNIIISSQQNSTNQLVDILEENNKNGGSGGGGGGGPSTTKGLITKIGGFLTGGMGLSGLLTSSMTGIATAGAGAMIGAAGLVAAAGAAGYAVGTVINKYVVDPLVDDLHKEQDGKIRESSTLALTAQQTSLKKVGDESLSMKERAKEKRKVKLGAMGSFNKDFGAILSTNDIEIAAKVKKLDADNMDLYSEYSVAEVKKKRENFNYRPVSMFDTNETYAKEYVDAFTEFLKKTGTPLTEVQKDNEAKNLKNQFATAKVNKVLQEKEKAKADKLAEPVDSNVSIGDKSYDASKKLGRSRERISGSDGYYNFESYKLGQGKDSKLLMNEQTKQGKLEYLNKKIANAKEDIKSYDKQDDFFKSDREESKLDSKLNKAIKEYDRISKVEALSKEEYVKTITAIKEKKREISKKEEPSSKKVAKALEKPTTTATKDEVKDKNKNLETSDAQSSKVAEIKAEMSEEIKSRSGLNNFDRRAANIHKSKQEAGETLSKRNKIRIGKVDREKKELSDVKALILPQIIAMKEKELSEAAKSITSKDMTEKEWNKFQQSRDYVSLVNADSYEEYKERESYKKEGNKKKAVELQTTLATIRPKKTKSSDALTVKPTPKSVPMALATSHDSTVKSTPQVKPINIANTSLKKINEKEKAGTMMDNNTLSGKSQQPLIIKQQTPQPMQANNQKKPTERGITSVGDYGVELLRSLLT